MQGINNKEQVIALIAKKLTHTSEEMPLERNIVIWEGEREEKEILIQKMWLDEGDEDDIIFLSSGGVRFHQEELSARSLLFISQSI